MNKEGFKLILKNYFLYHKAQDLDIMISDLMTLINEYIKNKDDPE